MNFETINMGGYNLHLIKTNKFKTITIDVDFYRNIKKEEITERNLLKMVLQILVIIIRRKEILLLKVRIYMILRYHLVYQELVILVTYLFKLNF